MIYDYMHPEITAKSVEDSEDHKRVVGFGLINNYIIILTKLYLIPMYTPRQPVCACVCLQVIGENSTWSLYDGGRLLIN